MWYGQPGEELAAQLSGTGTNGSRQTELLNDVLKSPTALLQNYETPTHNWNGKSRRKRKRSGYFSDSSSQSDDSDGDYSDILPKGKQLFTRHEVKDVIRRAIKHCIRGRSKTRSETSSQDIPQLLGTVPDLKFAWPNRFIVRTDGSTPEWEDLIPAELILGIYRMAQQAKEQEADCFRYSYSIIDYPSFGHKHA